MLSQPQPRSVPAQESVEAHASVPLEVVLLIESASFFVAALVQQSTQFPWQESTHAQAVDIVIGSLLVLGALAIWIVPARARDIGFGAQTCALFATSMGLLLLASGLPGRSSTYDLIVNAGALLLLNLGLIVVSRLR